MKLVCLFGIATLLLSGCHAEAHGADDHAAPGVVPSSNYGPLHEVAAIHGAAGPWAVAGYKMGDYALGKLSLPRQSFDLDVHHESPRSPQYACIADGAAAATGASIGKLNLSLAEVDLAHLETTFTRKSTGQKIVLRPTASFAAKFSNIPRDQLAAAGAEVLALPNDQVFETAP